MTMTVKTHRSKHSSWNRMANRSHNFCTDYSQVTLESIFDPYRCKFMQFNIVSTCNYAGAYGHYFLDNHFLCKTFCGSRKGQEYWLRPGITGTVTSTAKAGGKIIWKNIFTLNCSSVSLSFPSLFIFSAFRLYSLWDLVMEERALALSLVYKRYSFSKNK